VGLQETGQSVALSRVREDRLPQNMGFRVQSELQGHMAVHWSTSLTQNKVSGAK
jgi:hypothetical protein